MTLLDRIKALLPGINLDALMHAGEYELQRQLAPMLRAAAINHLRQGHGPVADSFREDFAATIGATDGITIDAFLKAQSKGARYDDAGNVIETGTYSTDIEAQALAELLDCHIVMTKYSGETKETTVQQLHEASTESTHIIRLYNDNNQHWQYAEQITMGGGDCLHHAFALAIQDMVRVELKYQPEPFVASAAHSVPPRVASAPDLTIEDMEVEEPAPMPRTHSQTELTAPAAAPLAPSAASLSSHGLFKYSADQKQKIIASQQSIADHFGLESAEDEAPEHPTVEAYKGQIQSDYELALELAEEEMRRASRST